MRRSCDRSAIIERNNRARRRGAYICAAVARACRTCASFSRRNCRLRSISLTPCATLPSRTRPMRSTLRDLLIFWGEVVGLARRAVASCPMELNLRPATVIRAREIERRRPFLIGTAGCMIAALLGWSIFYLHGSGVLRATKQQVDAKVETLRGLQGKLDGIRKDATTLDNLALPLLNAVKARSFWPQLLEDLNARLPKENIWVTELIPLSNGKPVIG